MFLFSISIYISTLLLYVEGDYDRFSGEKIKDALLNEMRVENATEKCNIVVKPCTPHEDRRIDGTCNNYAYPTKGAAVGPYLRLLKPDYGNDGDIRTDKNGNELPSARKVRTELHTTGRIVDKYMFNAAVYHMLEFIHADISSVNNPRNYLRPGQNCCQQENVANPRCASITVPKDDPYLKNTDIRCLNFSRVETFQDAGCAPVTKDLEQINYQTPTLDLSTIYGVDDGAILRVRKWENGLLKLEKRNNRYVPMLMTNSTNETCIQNKENETRCYGFGMPETGNINLRTAVLAIFFMREHNRLAMELHKINPCWKDDRLFKTARQINIATVSNIFMYELLPKLLGYKNMVNFNLISEEIEALNDYNEKDFPLVYAEYEIAMRYFRNILDGRIKRYSEQYRYIAAFSLGATVFRQHLIEEGKNFEEINRGMFYQRAAKLDDVQDPEISEHMYDGLQRTHDIIAVDIQKGRDMGIRGYNDYRRLCGMKPAKKFEDFADLMEMEKVEALRKLYKDIDDVDLLAGLMSETHMQGTYVGPTLFCIMAKQLVLFRFSDRFWFERGDQFHSFTLSQLNEMRKTNMARFACDNAEGIKYIQPQAFLNVKPGNMPVPCEHIPGPDLSKWHDDSCNRMKHSDGATRIPTHRNVRPHYLLDYTSLFDMIYKPDSIYSKT